MRLRLRLLLMGGILSTIGAILLVTRGFSTTFTGLLVIGILLFMVGLLRK
jgi:hypothetical protein